MKWITCLFLLKSSILFCQTTYFDKADSLEKLNNFNEALRYYSIAINTKEDTVDAYYRRAYMKMELKNYRGAVTDFATYLDAVKGQEYTRDKTIGISKMKGFTIDQVMMSHGMIGICYINLNNINDACKHFDKAQEYGYPNINEIIKKYCN